MPFDFTDEEWSRPNGHTVEVDGETLVWESAPMAWRVMDREGRYLGMRCPDHERARRDPEAAPVFALLHRMLSKPRKHLRLVAKRVS